MKTAPLFLASILIFLITSNSLSSATAQDIVYDAQGNELQKGISYIISPPIWGPLGGPVSLARSTSNDETCDFDVVQERFEVAPASPFIFTPVSPNEQVITLSNPISVDSPSVNPCNESNIWRVSSRDGLPVNIVTTGGYFNTPNSCFRITRPQEPTFPNSYIFEHCPFLCGPGVKLCYPIGIYNNNSSYISHLSAFGPRTFEVIFLKYQESVVAL